MASDILSFSYNILPSDWKDFKKRAKKHPNIGFGEGEKDENGLYDYAYLKKEKVFLAKFYTDEMEITTDINKANFFKFNRGANIDIYKSVMESIQSRNMYVVTLESYLGIQEPFKVVKGLKNANSVSEGLNSKETFVTKIDMYVNTLESNMSTDNLNRLETVKNLVVVSENKIESDSDFEKYANDRLKKKFGDKFDQTIADKVVNGLKDKYKGNYGAMVGALK